jgi:HK97 family phage major capsid protein
MTATVAENPLITALRDQRDAAQADLEQILKPATDEKRNLTDAEDATFAAKKTEIEGFDARIAEMVELDKRKADAAEARKGLGLQVNEPNPIYRRDDASSSFFKDLAAVQNPLLGASLGAGFDREARERLVRSQETRAGDMTTAAGAGGEFAPPLWLIEDFINFARAGRVTADLCNQNVLPGGVSSINLPKVASGTATAVQQTQNTNLQDTAMTTTSVSSGISTVGGKQIVSIQLLKQSGIPFDRVILQDLAADYAVRVDAQVLYGTNANGQVRGLVGVANNNAFTSASPAPASVTNANSLYYVVAKTAAALQTTIFQTADAIIMHPVRWGWISGAVDSNGRPFVIPNGNNFNPLGTTDGQPVQGAAGMFAGLPVYTDPNISQTANSATNQDEIYVVRRSDLWLYESAVEAASFDATYADQASILFRVLGFIAFLPHRRTGAVQSIRGTGLVTP